MIHEELAIRYSGVLSALKIIKWYNLFIIVLAGLSLFFFKDEMLLLVLLFTVNCIINYIFFKRICSYIENLNIFFTKDGSNNLKPI